MTIPERDLLILQAEQYIGILQKYNASPNSGSVFTPFRGLAGLKKPDQKKEIVDNAILQLQNFKKNLNSDFRENESVKRAELMGIKDYVLIQSGSKSLEQQFNDAPEVRLQEGSTQTAGRLVGTGIPAQKKKTEETQDQMAAKIELNEHQIASKINVLFNLIQISGAKEYKESPFLKKAQELTQIILYRENPDNKDQKIPSDQMLKQYEGKSNTEIFDEIKTTIMITPTYRNTPLSVTNLIKFVDEKIQSPSPPLKPQ